MTQSQARTEVEQLAADFARNANAKNTDALTREFYAREAVLLPPGTTPVRGIDGIRAFWQSMLDAGAGEVALKTSSVESSGDLAYEVGEYRFTMPDGKGGKSPQAGKYLVVYKRQPDGTLRAVADMFSSNT